MKPVSALIFLILASKLFAQYEKDIHKLTYINSSGEKGFTTYIYNGKEYPYKAIWELEDGSRWSENYHKYDDNGNMIRKERTFSDSLITLQTFKYDLNNHLIHETFARSDGVNGIVDYIYSDGKLKEADCKGLNGWFHGRIIYNYNKSNDPVSAELRSGDQKVGEIIFSYNIHFQLIKEVWNFNTGFSQTFIYEYIDTKHIHYRSSNVFIRENYPWRIEEEKYEYSGQVGGPSYYIYNDSGKLVEKTFVRSDGLKTAADFYYLDNGLLKESLRHYSDGKTGTFQYTYSSDNNLTYRSFEKSDG